MNKKMFGRYRVVLAMMLVCMLMLAACGKEEYNTDSLKEINVLTTETAMGGESSQENDSNGATGAISIVGEGDTEATTDGSNTNLAGGDVNNGYTENTTGGDANGMNSNNNPGGDVNGGNAENNQEGGETLGVYDQVAAGEDVTLEEAMTMMEEVDTTNPDGIQWTDLDQGIQGTGDDSDVVTYEDIDLTPSSELEQTFDDIIDGKFEGEDDEATASAGSKEYE